MCVIFSCQNEMPTLEQLEQAEKSNPHGGGYGCLIKGKLHYRKGLTAKEIHEDIKNGKLQSPCLIHFRIKSVGVVNSKLTHPFEISDTVDLNLSGSFGKKSDVEGLFFHNGTVTNWETSYFNAVRFSQSKMLKGIMSDSRALAFIVKKYGHECLEYLDPKDTYNRYAVIDFEGIHTYGNWVKCGSVMASNNYFEVSEDDIYTNYGIGNNYGCTRFYNRDGKNKADYADDDFEFDISNESDYLEPNYNPVKAQKSISEFQTKPDKNPKSKQSYQDLVLKRDSLIKRINGTQNKIDAQKKINSAKGDTINPKYRKRDRKADIRYLREHGWKSPNSLSNAELVKEVENMQKNQSVIKAVREKTDSGFKISYKDYQEIADEQNDNYESYIR